MMTGGTALVFNFNLLHDMFMAAFKSFNMPVIVDGEFTSFLTLRQY
jgi:hypothetical protein